MKIKILITIMMCYFCLQAQTVMHIWKNGAKIDSVQVANDLKLTFSWQINPELEVEMVTFQGGTFMMGSNDYFQTEPIHNVTLNTFKIAKYEVTQKLWVAVIGTNPSYFTGDENRPVEQVSWNDVQLFITKLNQLTGKNYRLPTEAEWEYAARGGNQSQGYAFAGSNDVNSVAWHNGNSGSTTHPVGTKAPNELGLYDMSGNVHEFCQDWFSENYYGISPSNNPTGPSTGTLRVCRGGSYGSNLDFCRSVYRNALNPNNKSNRFGFRLVEDL